MMEKLHLAVSFIVFCYNKEKPIVGAVSMFVCKKCQGVLVPIAIEEIPEELSKQQKLVYNRVCDVECMSCGKVYYSMPYDGNESLNVVKKTKKLNEK